MPQHKIPFAAMIAATKKVPRVGGKLDDPNGSPLLCFSRFDPFPEWNEKNHASDQSNFLDMAVKIRDCVCKRSWGEIKQAKDKEHEVALPELSESARKRLKELMLDDVQSVFTFRFSNLERFCGVVVDRVFFVLWWDPFHQVATTKGADN